MRRVGRSAAVAVGVAGTLLLCAGAAYAGEAEPDISLGRDRSGPGSEIQDSAGNSLWQFDMYFEDQGSLNIIGNITVAVIKIFWGLYRLLAGFAIWFIDWVIGFDWLAWISRPVESIGDGIADVITSTFSSNEALVAFLLTITAFVCAIWMLRGRWALGVVELAVGLVIASLATGQLSDPVGAVTGEDGFVYESRDLGLRIVHEITAAEATGDSDSTGTDSGDFMRERLRQKLMDSLVRKPAQVINFGTTLNGGETGVGTVRPDCESEYDALLQTPPGIYSTDEPSTVQKIALSQYEFFFSPGGEVYDDIVDVWTDEPTGKALAECNPRAALVAASPSTNQVGAAFFIFLGSAMLIVFAFFLAGATFLAAFSVLFQSLKAIVVLLTAVLPGGARRALWQTLADVFVSLVVLVFSVVFLGAYLEIISSVLDDVSNSGNGVMTAFLVIDVLLVVGVILFWRARTSILRSSERLAQSFAQKLRPAGAGGPTSLPATISRRQRKVDEKRDRTNSVRTARAEKMGQKQGGGRPRPQAPSPKQPRQQPPPQSPAPQRPRPQPTSPPTGGPRPPKPPQPLRTAGRVVRVAGRGVAGLWRSQERVRGSTVAWKLRNWLDP